MKYIEKHPMIMIVIGVLGISLSSIFVKYSTAALCRDCSLPPSVDGSADDACYLRQNGCPQRTVPGQ